MKSLVKQAEKQNKNTDGHRQIFTLSNTMVINNVDGGYNSNMYTKRMVTTSVLLSIRLNKTKIFSNSASFKEDEKLSFFL